MSGEAIIKEAKKYLNYNNWFEFETGRKLDNSGLVVLVYKNAVGKSLPHYTGSLINMGTKVERKDLQLGDLVFTTANHVGIFAGNNQFIHFTDDGKVRLSNIYSFFTARRII